jgi:hypothetical protein
MFLLPGVDINVTLTSNPPLKSEAAGFCLNLVKLSFSKKEMQDLAVGSPLHFWELPRTLFCGTFPARRAMPVSLRLRCRMDVILAGKGC